MDRPRSKAVPVVKGILALVSVLVAVFWIIIAVRFVGGYISPDSGAAPGNIGHLFVALFFFLLAAPFGAIAFTLGAPLVSRNPKFRGADR